MCSDAPDPDPLIGQAAMANAALAKEAMQYYRDRDAAQAPRQAKMDELTERLANQQIETSQFNDKMARDQWTRYQAQGIPAEDAMYADAANYDSKEARDKAAGQAATDVDASMAMANDARRRQLARSGVNPADGRALSMEQDAATQGGLLKAGAMNQARDARETQGIMLRKDAAAFGRGATGTAAQTFGVASAAGGQATGAVGAAIGAANSTTQTQGAGFGTAVNANSSAGGMMNTQYQTQVQQAGQGGAAGALGGLGQLGQGLGAMGLMFSDENMKEDREPVDGRAALRGIQATNVEKWKYKDDSPAADGGQEHIGAMAQDLQENLGDTVSNGTTVDVISAIGANMAATKELAKKVDRLAAKGVKR